MTFNNFEMCTIKIIYPENILKIKMHFLRFIIFDFSLLRTILNKYIIYDIIMEYI